MRTYQRIAVLAGVASALVLLAGVSSSNAQGRKPATGTFAAGADVGVFVPRDDLGTTVTVDAFGEYYVTPRVSIRGALGWADPELPDPHRVDLRQARLTFNVLYNWERVAWHPFVTAGLGAYFVQLNSAGVAPFGSDTKAGLNLGGGLEYFPSSSLSIKGEAAYHVVGHNDLDLNPSGLALTIGLKKYF